MTSAEFAILTLIVEQPRHGYEIERIIEARGMREWTEVGFSSIYYLLKKLEKNGLITSRTETADGRGPARKVYRPTQAGLESCREATVKALGTMHRCYPPLHLGIANLRLVSSDAALGALREHRDALSRRLVNLQQKTTAQQPLPDEAQAMFDYSLTMVEAERNWIARYIQQLEHKDGAGKPSAVKE
ncbi:MAG: PadR family transcriptional regulator [Candidatus Promineifilaceae bacterium]|nr:PadR family transcriptional regulator [Candidatus Promineifilaceae bacterium]